MPRTTTLNATDALALVENVANKLHAIDDKQVKLDPDRGSGRRNDPEQAAVSRELLHLADQLALAEGEVRSLYWHLKGQSDPRFD